MVYQKLLPKTKKKHENIIMKQNILSKRYLQTKGSVFWDTGNEQVEP